MAAVNDPLRQNLIRSLVDEGLRPLLVATPEPEVAKATMKSVQCKSLAAIIAGLLAEHEPMLKAECDSTNATVTVREIGGPGVMIVKVTSE